MDANVRKKHIDNEAWRRHIAEKSYLATGMKFKLLILDFDGTIGDTRSTIVKTMQETIAAMKLPFRTEDECAAMIGLPLKQTFTDLLPIDDSTGERCTEIYGELFQKYNLPGAVSAFPHVTETISELYSRDIILTIATSRKRPSLVAFLQEMKLEKYISQIVTVQDVAHAKPSPDMVLKILGDTPHENYMPSNSLRYINPRSIQCSINPHDDTPRENCMPSNSNSSCDTPRENCMPSNSLLRCRILPQEALTVGDAIYDIKMGRSAGTRTCGVTYGNGKRADLSAAGADWLIDDFAELLEIC